MNNRKKYTSEEVVAEILASTTDMIAPGIFSHCYGRAATSAAFRMAKERGLIEVNYIGGTGVPVYKLSALARAFVAVEGVAQ